MTSTNDLLDANLDEELETVEDNDDSNELEESDSDTIDPSKYSQIYNSPSDWTVTTLIDQIVQGNIRLDPSYQRKDAWKKKEKSKFIESLILNIPVPNMLFAEEIGKRGTFNVLDGKQRLLSILEFYGVRIKGQKVRPKMKLSGLKILQNLNGKNIDQLRDYDASYVIALDNYSIRTTSLRNIPSVEYLYEIFERINMGSKKLSPQELRQSRYPGPFLSFLHIKAEEDNLFREFVNPKESDGRMRDIELMLRGHAFKYFLQDYPNSISLFLDESTEKLNKDWLSLSVTVQNFQNEMENAIVFTKELFGSDAFKLVGLDRKNFPFNRAVFDLMIYFFSEKHIRDILKESGNCEKFKKLYIDKLVKNPEFEMLLTQNTHQGSITRKRFYMFYKFLVEEFNIDSNELLENIMVD